ncbi:MAG: hypothetical protein MK554_13985, partial [Planctomycetes bacterium]|nr:hypothetical protein [Planctomycetota bacterium]
TPDFGSVLSRAKATGPWQVGIFSVELDTRWNNFIASDNSTAVDFDDLADWGDRSTAAGLEREFTDGARVFLERPTRSSIFALTAALSGAENIYRQLGAKARHEKLSASAAGLLDPLKLAARGLGEEDLLVRCFAMGASSASDRRRILGAGGTDFSALGDRFAGRSRFAEAAVYYAAALSIKDDPRLVGKLAEVKGKIPVPSYSLEIDEEKVRNRVVAQSRFRTAVQGTYGGLPRQDDGDLRIRVQIKRSSASTDAEPATRRVPILVGGGGMSATERRELERLESDLPEFLLDAKARAEVRRLSSQLGGVDEARGALDAYTIGNMKYELHIDDGKRALKDHARLSALRAKWDGLKSKLSYEEIEAERTTVSIKFSAAVELVYRGQILVAAGELSAYRGLVLWLHDAVAEKGIEGSSLSKDDLRPAAEAVRRRVLGQFAGHISKAKMQAKMGRTDRLAQLLRLARASGNTEDILSLRWYLGRDFDFTEVRCDEVSGRFFRPRPSEEFYDTVKDFDNINNLAGDPAHKAKIAELKQAMRKKQLELFDTGLLPENMRLRRAQDNGMTIYEMVRDPKLYPLEKYLDFSDVALSRNPAHLDRLVKAMKDPDEGIRYWATCGLFLLEDKARPALKTLEKALADGCTEVQMMAAWAMHRLGFESKAEATLATVKKVARKDKPIFETILRLMSAIHPARAAK